MRTYQIRVYISISGRWFQRDVFVESQHVADACSVAREQVEAEGFTVPYLEHIQ